jgi:hypothetical protein
MRIERSDKVPAAALIGFLLLFGGAKIMLAETAKAAKPRGGLGSVTTLREATRLGCDRFRATRRFDVPRRNWISAWPARSEEAVCRIKKPEDSAEVQSGAVREERSQRSL